MPNTPPDPRVTDVLILQHTLEDGPGFLGEWLDAQGHTWQVRCTEAGDDYPATIDGHRALAVLGGEWGANDNRPSLRQAEDLIRQADARGIPVLGHCLGGQLMARAFGGRVERLPEPEVGWFPIQAARGADPVLLQDWMKGLGPAGRIAVYQWHYDSFVQLPPGARLLASSAACAHQAFAIGPHLAMQFHVEITPEKIDAWLKNPGTVYPEAVAQGLKSVQAPGDMRAFTLHCQAGSLALANAIYAAWRRRWPAG